MMRRLRKKHSSFGFVPKVTVLLAVIIAGWVSYQLLKPEKIEPQAQTQTEGQIEQQAKTEKQEQVKPAEKEEQPAAEKNTVKEGMPVKTEQTETNAPITFSQPGYDVETKVNRLMEDMTIEEKIGQLMVIGFQSKDIDSHVKKMIEDYKVGGIILYDRNMETPSQVTRLTNDLQELAAKNPHQVPLMLSIDQEGGKIVRMKKHVSPIPSQQELGQKGNLTDIYHTAYRTGKELAAMGIQVNFAPVLDLSETDSRSFGADPAKTKVFGQQVVKGLADAGVEATLKHFPGNGRSNVDPHIETSSVQANQWDLENKDIYPFKKIMDEVDHNRFFVMVTHIKYPAYDKENPASISPIIIQQLLRQKLGYKGIVVTDDLEMGAVNKYFTYEDLGYRAVESGADILLVCHTLENQKKVFNGILKAVQANKLSEETIDEAVKRILTYKLTSITSVHADQAKAQESVGK
ncbi:beta-N-acetylhexosaminidase [Bacillus fengqiuensis]|nr:beta-N-acetylhexosaminidase [Bacillus fengqiuensis]